MPKSFFMGMLGLLLLFSSSLTALAEKETKFDHESGQSSPRQDFTFPGVPVPIPGLVKFPEFGKLLCYIPYQVQVKTPRDGIISIILVKKLSEEYAPTTAIHEKAKEAITVARNSIWLKWQKFRNDLEDNKVNIAKEIAESSDLVKDIKNKQMWKKPLKFNSSNATSPNNHDWVEPEELNLINQGKNISTGALYPVGLIYPDESQAYGLAVRYERGNFAPLYDIEGVISDNYWEFVTEYVRQYGTAVIEPDWDNPESWGKPVELPPATFNVTR